MLVHFLDNPSLSYELQKSDAGLYKLTAENALGSDSLEIDLIVLDDLDGCECAMFSTADLACTCRHRYGQFTFNFSKATLLDDYERNFA